MPCYDERNSDPRYIREAAQRDFRHNSDVAELLCAVCKANPAIPRNNPKLAAWWKEHQERDARKQEHEKREAAKTLAAVEIQQEASKVAAKILKKHGLDKL